MIRRVRAGAAVFVAATLAFAAGCGSSDSGSGGGGSDKALTKVTYVTGFGATGQEAFAWVAKDKGYFKEAGLDVDIQLGAGTDNNLKQISSGKAQFSNIDFAGGLIVAGKGANRDFKFIAALHQRTLLSVMSLEGNNVNTPKDLEGKKLGSVAGSVNEKLFPAYAKLAGVDAQKVVWVKLAQPQLVAALASHRIEALSGYLTRQPEVEKVSGKKAVVMAYGDYLSDLYGGSILASNTWIKDKPEVVKAFREALMKGLAYSLAHPEESGEILHKAKPTTDAAVAAGEIKLTQPMSASEPIGAISEVRISKSIALAQSLGLINAGMTPADLVALDMAPKA